MEKLRQLLGWAEAHPKVWLDCVRIYLGLGLFIRGVLIVTNDKAGYIREVLVRDQQSVLLTAVLLHYVALAHFVGGAMLTVGLLTRVAAWVQIPILAGAVFFVHRNDGLFAMGQSLEFSALVLFLLVVFLLSGAGPLSADRAIFGTRKPAPALPGH